MHARNAGRAGIPCVLAGRRRASWPGARRTAVRRTSTWGCWARSCARRSATPSASRSRTACRTMRRCTRTASSTSRTPRARPTTTAPPVRAHSRCVTLPNPNPTLLAALDHARTAPYNDGTSGARAPRCSWRCAVSVKAGAASVCRQGRLPLVAGALNMFHMSFVGHRCCKALPQHCHCSVARAAGACTRGPDTRGHGSAWSGACRPAVGRGELRRASAPRCQGAGVIRYRGEVQGPVLCGSTGVRQKLCRVCDLPGICSGRTANRSPRWRPTLTLCNARRQR
jgi:hypothetical protein